MDIQNDIYQDVIDYILKEADSAQIRRVEAWIDLDEKNKKDFQQLVQTCQKVAVTRKWNRINVPQAKNNLLVHLKKQRRLRIYRYTAIAASIALLVSFSLIFYVNKFESELENLPLSELTAPGEFKATLTLSNGETINLSEQKKNLVKDAGAIINLDTLEGINYQNNTVESKEKQQLVYNILKVARGEEYKVVLADGTTVWLNADSELRYPVHFTADSRQVYLKGEAYFDVAHNKKKAFLVQSYDQQVKVYGTEFCVNAYKSDEIRTVLVEGSVGVRANKKGIESKLKPGELGTTNVNTGGIDIKKVDVRPYVAWKDGDFVFMNESLENIMLRLERWYDVKIFFMNEECKGYRFTGDVERYSDVRDLLFFIQETSNAKFEIKNNTIVVMAK